MISFLTVSFFSTKKYINMLGFFVDIDFKIAGGVPSEAFIFSRADAHTKLFNRVNRMIYCVINHD